MSRTLSVGDVIKATPCVVTINTRASTKASGICSTCHCLHLIDLPRYESGQGPWQPAEPERVECVDCGLVQTHRVCELCYETSLLLDRLPETAWDVAVWDDRTENYVLGRVDSADRRALVREILGQQTPPITKNENPTSTVSSLSREDLLTVLHAWSQADFGDRDAILAAERLAARLGLEAGHGT